MTHVPPKKDIANALGVARSRVTALVAEGMPTSSVEEAKSWYRANVRGAEVRASATAGAAESGDDGSLLHWRMRRERAQAEKIERDNRVKSGELVDKAGTERAAFAYGKLIQKTLIDVLPSKLAMELAALSDPWQVECYLRESMRAELAAIAGTTTAELEQLGRGQ